MKISVSSARSRSTQMQARQLTGCHDSGRTPTHGPSRRSGFTMVEIALALGIIGFALVAIVGVLPSGLQVQRENREETIINQDAKFLLEAIRSGSKGVDDLTNYVESITIKRGRFATDYYTNNVLNPGGLRPLTNAQHIISLLSTPKVEWLQNYTLRQTNQVRAQIRAISGAALEKSRKMEDFAFRYQVTVEIVPFVPDWALTNLTPQIAAALGPEGMRALNLNQNLYDVRLLVRWPVFQRGSGWEVGRYRRTWRTLVSGELMPVYTNSTPYLYLFQPYTYLSAH